MSRERKADLIGKAVVLALMVVFTAVGIYTLLGKKADNGGTMSAGRGGGLGAATVTVSVKTMEPQTLQKTVLLNGEVKSRTETSIYPDTSGKVSRLLKSLGDFVRRGEVIAYVDPSRPGSAYAASPVIATVSGTLIQLPVNVGDTVSTSTALAVIGSLQDLEITVNVSEKYSSYLKDGLPAYVSLVSAPDTSYTAHIVSVSPVVNSASRTQEVDLILNQQDERIRPGMFAQVRLVILEEKDAFVVPLSAIRSYNDQPAVFVVSPDDTARRVIVALGISNDNDVQVVSGLEQGDRVITAGAVTEGIKVHVAAARQDSLVPPDNGSEGEALRP